METEAPFESRPARRIPWRALAGPLLTVGIAVLIEVLRPTPLYSPGPGVVLMIAVAWGTYVGGLGPGLASVAIAVAYGAWYFLGPSAAPDPDRVRRFADLALGAVTVAGLLGVLRRRARRARQAEGEAAVARQYGMLFEEAGEPMLLSDGTHRYVFVNRRACEVSGYSREELLRMRVGDLVSPQSQAERPLRLEELRRRGEMRLERELLRRDGSRLQVEVTARRLRDGRTLAILRDVTGERESVARLQQALSLVRATLESTADGILVVDVAGRWAGHNQKFREMWNIPAELAESGDDDRALEYVLSQLESPGDFLGKVRELYAAPEASSFDEIRFRDGRVFERYSVPQRTGDRIVGRVWSFRDVTAARRQAEALHATQQRMLHAEKLEAVGRLAGGVAHDFNNMLTAILGEADLLLLQPRLDAGTRVQVENIRNAALRSAQLTRQLLAFARQQHTEPRPFALAELVRGLEPLVQRLAGRLVVTRFELPDGGGSPWVHADPSQFEQAVLNLVINAADAMPEGGELVLRVGREVVTAGDRARRGARHEGAHARLSVADSGCGIPAEALPYLFEPFFTTKPPGRGTGLGLASVHGIVQQAQGFIEVESEVGRGSTFHVLLPEHEPRPGSAPAAAAAEAVGAGRGRPRVLVVDDEEQVRRFVVAVLSEAGYDVLEADGADEACELVRESPVELLVSDVVMPGTNGAELARRLTAEGRVGRVLFMSGYPGPALREQLAELASAPLIHKPFRSDELLERVRGALGMPPAPARPRR